MKSIFTISILLSFAVCNAQNFFNPEWVTKIEGTDAKFRGIVNDEIGNSYIGIEDGGFLTIDSITFGGVGASYLIKLDTLGKYEWHRWFSSVGLSTKVYLENILIDENNHVVVAGSFFNQLYLNGEDSTIHGALDLNTFVMRLDLDGNIVNYFLFEDTFHIVDMHIDGLNNLYILAYAPNTLKYFEGDTLIGNTLIIKYDDNNNLLWYLEQNVPANDPSSGLFYYYMMDLSTDEENNFYVHYELTDTMHLNDNFYSLDSIVYYYFDSIWIEGDSFQYNYDTSIFLLREALLVKYDADGEELWHSNIHSDNSASIRNIVLDDIGNVYLTIYTYSYSNTYYNDSVVMYAQESDYAWIYSLLKISSDGNFIRSYLNTENLNFYNRFLYNKGALYNPGYKVESDTYHGATVTTLDSSLQTVNITESTCSEDYNRPTSEAFQLSFVDSNMYMYGEVDKCMELGDLNVHLAYNKECLFVAKLHSNFSIPYVVPDSLLYTSSDAFLYPIPARDVLFLSMNDSTSAIQSIVVCNTLGQFFEVGYTLNNINTVQFSTENLHPGLYFLILTISGQQRTYKFIKS